MTTGVRSAGEFCWINMLTPEPRAACDFFATVLGWTYGDIPGMGYVVKAGGHEIGGLFDQPFAALDHGGERKLDGFLAELLRALGDATVQ